MSAHFIDKVVLNALDAEMPSNPEAVYLARKIEEKLAAYRGKRDHNGFNGLFEAYSEALVFLAARHRHVALRAVPDGGKYGKTPDFETLDTPSVGLEVKTLNAADPIATVDDVMNRGFEANYEAEQASRENARTSPNGLGIGFGITTYAPHGEGAGEAEAVTQTMSKLSGNIKEGQYSARPTFLVVSLARLGLRGGAEQLQRWINDPDGRANGHLYTVAAHPLETSFHSYGREHWDGPEDLGQLPRVGVLRDYPFIAGVIFVNQVGSQAHSIDYFSYAVRFHGIWNNAWERDAAFSSEQKQAARAVFDKLCDASSDLDDTFVAGSVDERTLHSAFYRHLETLQTLKGQPAAGAAFEAFMVEADRLHFAWRAALRKVDVTNYTPRDPADIVAGPRDDGNPSLSWLGAQPHPKVPPMALVKLGKVWALDETGLGPVQPGEVTL